MVNRTGRKERRTAMLQEQEQRHVYYDRDLDIEAYNLSGIVQKFPNHFHEYYVIALLREKAPSVVQGEGV